MKPLKIIKILWVSIIIILGLCALAHAQDNISIGLYQDARLLVLGDDKGNNAGTLDAKLDISLQGKQFQYYYFEMRVQAEYADLNGGKYASWLVCSGWVLNQLIVKNLEAGAYLTIGAIHRWQGAYGTYGVTGDLSYKLGNLKISALYQIINRGDLVARWNEQNAMKPNFYIGVKYNLL